MMLANARRTRYQIPDPNIGLDLVRATEAAAMAASGWAGRGEQYAGDQAAVDAMRDVLNAIRMRGVIVIGEGEKDNAPMLPNGEAFGTGGGHGYDIAVDPVDGTELLAGGMGNSISAIAASDRGTMYDPKGVFFMDKLVVGPDVDSAQLDLDAPVADTIGKVAKARGVAPSDITVAMLQRARHGRLADDVRAAGARISFVQAGDIAAAIAATRPATGVDLMLGIGGTPEGIITACAMKAIGGTFLGRLAPQSEREREHAEQVGHDLTRVFTQHDLVSGDNAFFVATGITDGWLLDGVRYLRGAVRTRSIVMRSRSGTVRTIESVHPLSRVEGESNLLLEP